MYLVFESGEYQINDKRHETLDELIHARDDVYSEGFTGVGIANQFKAGRMTLRSFMIYAYTSLRKEYKIYRLRNPDFDDSFLVGHVLALCGHLEALMRRHGPHSHRDSQESEEPSSCPGFIKNIVDCYTLKKSELDPEVHSSRLNPVDNPQQARQSPDPTK
ncbi:hypothetical protein RF11_05022 [Thelohanellus kitauei]|uniref:Uncharacterized protein n=1 Tax=Thelohanellus kitauei TaxID=669202 RepID=A0A0C2N067_THEKT|nr:hypothetical protein RF11_05022 [Thelohanellus kitauei]